MPEDCLNKNLSLSSPETRPTVVPNHDPCIMDPLLTLAFDDDFEETVGITLLLTIMACGQLSRLLRAEGRRRHRLYLCRPELIQNPRVGSPWQVLYQSQSDHAFITTMGLDTVTFHLLLNTGFEFLWDSTPIPRTDTNANGEPRLGARSLDAAGGLGLYLHYVRSSMREVGLQLIFALIPSTVSRYLSFTRQILLDTLRRYPAARVAWPDGGQFGEMTNLIQVTHVLPVCNASYTRSHPMVHRPDTQCLWAQLGCWMVSSFRSKFPQTPV